MLICQTRGANRSRYPVQTPVPPHVLPSGERTRPRVQWLAPSPTTINRPPTHAVRPGPMAKAILSHPPHHRKTPFSLNEPIFVHARLSFLKINSPQKPLLNLYFGLYPAQFAPSRVICFPSPFQRSAFSVGSSMFQIWPMSRLVPDKYYVFFKLTSQMAKSIHLQSDQVAPSQGKSSQVKPRASDGQKATAFSNTPALQFPSLVPNPTQSHPIKPFPFLLS